MNDPKIPSYPVVHVTVQPDGSAHVNAAGDHRNYPAGDLEETRAQVKAYAIAVANRLGRGVRMSTTEPHGEWKLGVYPDGEVVDLAPAPVKGRASAKAVPPQRRPVAAAPLEPPTLTNEMTTVVIERNERDVVPPPAARGSQPPAATAVATLKFSTGDIAIIGPPASIGRNPSSVVLGRGGSQLVVISDHSRSVSRAHADVAWINGKLMVTDRAAGNGTSITRPTKGRFDLPPGKPCESLDGDVLHIGTDVTCSVTISYVRDTR